MSPFAAMFQSAPRTTPGGNLRPSGRRESAKRVSIRPPDHSGGKRCGDAGLRGEVDVSIRPPDHSGGKPTAPASSRPRNGSFNPPPGPLRGETRPLAGWGDGQRCFNPPPGPLRGETPPAGGVPPRGEAVSIRPP